MTYSCSRKYFRLEQAAPSHTPSTSGIVDTLTPLLAQVAFAAGVVFPLALLAIVVVRRMIIVDERLGLWVD